MTQTGEVTKRPGIGLIQGGLMLAFAGVLLTIAILSGGGNANGLWLVLIGLVLAGIGFARRVLHALENKQP